MDEKEIKKLKKDLLKILITARNLVEQGKEQEAIDLMASDEFTKKYNLAYPNNYTNPFDRLRNAITYMCWKTDSSESERAQSRAKITKETGKKDSLRLIAEIEEELAD